MATNPLPPLLQASSGAFGSVVSNAAVYPLDTVTKRLQVKGRKGGYRSPLHAFRAILDEEGPFGLYKGLGADTLSTLLSNFLYFYGYSFFRSRLSARKKARGLGDKLSAVEEIVVGVIAGILSRAVISPLSQITVRQQTAADPKANEAEVQAAGDDSDDEDGGYTSPSIFEVAKQIVDEKGVLGLWAGFDAACILTLNPSITLLLFERLKRLTIPRAYIDKPTSTQTFFASAIASSLASVITYPLMLAKTRQQWRSPSGRQVYKGLFDVIRKTLRRQGPKGLFQGLNAQVAKSFVQLGITMTVKQRLELLVIYLYRRAQSGKSVVSTA